MCLKPYSLPEESDKTTTPFGRAFYEGKASYYVLPYPILVLINLVVVCSVAVYWSGAGVVSAVVLQAIHTAAPGLSIFKSNWYQFGAIYGLLAGIYVVVITLQAIYALTWATIAKWALMGRRLVGEYNWDKSSYCQRWKLHLTLSNIVGEGLGGAGLLRSIAGTAYIVWYYRANGAKIGKDCSIFAGGDVGLMTEPDLVEVSNFSLITVPQIGTHATIPARG